MFRYNCRCEELRQYSCPANTYLLTCRFPIECYVGRHLWLLTENLLRPLFQYSHQPFFSYVCGWSKKLFASALHSKVKTTSSSQPDFLSALFVFIIDVNMPTWEDCSMTVAVFHYPLSLYWCHLFLYTVQSHYSILQTAKLVRWKCWTFLSCWTIEICTDIGISKPIQPDTLINKTYTLYSMCWKCFVLLLTSL